MGRRREVPRGRRDWIVMRWSLVVRRKLERFVVSLEAILAVCVRDG